MGNAGRFFCVALPFILTAGSIICLLVVGLAGVTSNSLYMFQVNTTGLTINRASIENLLKLGTRSPGTPEWHDASFLGGSDGTSSKAQGSASDITQAATAQGNNITAADLTLANLYDVNLWGYCTTSQSGNRNCTKAQFDWAETSLNTSVLSAVSGANITLPTGINDSLKAFKTVTKWTEVVYIIAMVALGLELVVGAFTSCSRAVSCVTWLVSGIASVAVIAAAAMVTAMSVIVIGAVEGTAKFYGVKGSINTSFLAVMWLGAAFALAAGLFWFFTICCCKPEHRSKNRRSADHEKLLPTGSYAPLHEDNSNRGYNQQYGVPRHQSHGPRRDLAYEPYSHSNV